MSYCCIIHCKNSYRRGKAENTSFFHFPRRDKSPQRYKQWVKRIGRADFIPSRFSVVCELHFRKEDLDESRQLKKRFLPQYKTFPRLKKTAVPTLMLKPESISNEEDKVVKERKSVYLRKKLVQEAIDELEESESILKAKWKGLRDTFRLELKKPYQESTWSFYNQMMFIKDHMKSRPTPLKIPDGQESIPQRNIKEEPNDFEPDCEYVEYDEQEASGSASASFDHVSQDEPSMDESSNVNVFQQQYNEPSMDIDNEKDDDYHFLMSFLPEMKKLDVKKKMLLRIKMMELFYKETYDPDYS